MRYCTFYLRGNAIGHKFCRLPFAAVSLYPETEQRRRIFAGEKLLDLLDVRGIVRNDRAIGSD